MLSDMLGSMFYERRRVTTQTVTDLRDTAHAHRRVYQAIRARNREAARAEMDDHLRHAQAARTSEAAHTSAAHQDLS
jgi:DNA-binding FadR family transcriptional regulator